MVVLKCTLNPDYCLKLHHALSCLAKFSDTVSIEASRHGQLILTALNSSKSAYASFALDKQTFFSTYEFVPDPQAREGRFACRVLNRALLSAFKGRLADGRGGATEVERCEINLQDRDDGVECRFVIKMICRLGVTKTYKLTYEPAETMHALFDKSIAKNTWKIQARRLREYIDFFGMKTEQLDIFADEGRVILTSYTEKIANAKEVLKQPLHTAVSIGIEDFEEFKAEEGFHIAINVKDFKNIVIHGDTLRTSITAIYSRPSRPLQFSYSIDGMMCEVTLMTIGGPGETITPNIARSTTREPQRRGSSVLSKNAETSASVAMPPPKHIPSRTNNNRQQRTLGRRSSTTTSGLENDQQSETLFLPTTEDEESQWEPAETRLYEEDMLGWDASGGNSVQFASTLRHGNYVPQDHDQGVVSKISDAEIAPTQRASQIRGLFD